MNTKYSFLLQVPLPAAIVSRNGYVIEEINTHQLQWWSQGEDRLKGKPLFEGVPEAHPLEGTFQKVIATGEACTAAEVAFTTMHNGVPGWAWFDVACQPLLSEGGEVESILLLSTDVTRHVAERRKAEAEAAGLYSLANAMPQLVWIAGPDGTVTYYNEQVAQFAGAHKLPDGNWNWEGLLHPDDLQPTADAWQKAVAEGCVYEKEHRIQMKDGTYRWHLSRGYPYIGVQGKIVKWYGTATDIHRLKRTKEALTYQKGLLETVTRNTEMALFMLDTSSRLVYQNEAAEKMTGYSLDELRGRSLHDHIHHSRPDGNPYPVDECPLAGALRQSRRTTGEEVFIHKDGSFYPVYFSASPVLVEGVFMGMVLEVRDATEEKAAQQALQESEERLRVATAAAGIGTWSYDLLHDVVYASDQYKRLFGLSPHRAMTYELFLQAVVEEDRALTDRVNREVIEMKAGQTDYVWEYRVRGIEDGQLRWLKARGKVYPGADGRPARFAGAVMDITREKEAQISLSYRKALLEAQNNTIPDGLLVVDTKGKMLSFNRRFAEIWRMPAAITEAGDDNAALRFAMSQVPDPQAFIDRVHYIYQHATEAAREEIELIDGRILERYGTAVIDEHKTFYGWAWYFRDITDSKRAETALRQSEEKFRLLANFMPQIVWTAGPNGAPDYYNGRWFEYTGVAGDTVDASWIAVIHHDDRQACIDTWRQSIRTGDTFQVEYRLREAATGDYRWHLGKAVAVRDFEGTIIKWFGTSTDIDDQKRFAERLEELVAQRTLELSRSNEDLQRFAHVASHDLKEPLRKIRTFASRLHDDGESSLSERGRMYLHKVESAAERMSNMIEGVLAYSTVSASREAPQPVDLSEVIQNIVLDLEVVIQQKSARITAGDLPLVVGAPVLIHQLFYNLVNNALKFARPGVPPQVDIRAERGTGGDAAMACIAVRDNGIGFEPKHAEVIFDTFTRLNPKDKFEGTGLGLSLCKKIVERHGGTIRAEGIEGQGATFIITLPLHKGN